MPHMPGPGPEATPLTRRSASRYLSRSRLRRGTFHPAEAGSRSPWARNTGDRVRTCERWRPMNGTRSSPAKVQRPHCGRDARPGIGSSIGSRPRFHQPWYPGAGRRSYGKTTLLADFSQRTRLRTLWYRLDDEDRDWISFLSHLIAAVENTIRVSRRQRPRCSATSRRRPTREAATDVFLRELPRIAEHGAAYPRRLPHRRRVARCADDREESLSPAAPEGCPSCRQPADPRSRSPECAPRARSPRSGRTTPIDATETARLFAETYGRSSSGRPRRCHSRTEGWAASLQLVQAPSRPITARSAVSFGA